MPCSAGEIDYECDPVLGTLAHVRAGNLKALAIAARKRSPMLPDVPTSYEQGLPEFDCAPFYGVFAPSGTPKPIIERLVEALNKGLSEEAVQKRLADLGAEHRRAGPPRTESPGRPGEKRNRAADADPESCGRQIAASPAIAKAR